jgi:hypothetical protein
LTPGLEKRPVTARSPLEAPVRAFAFYFMVGSLIGLVMCVIGIPLIGQAFWWMVPVAGVIHGTLRGLHVEEGTLVVEPPNKV